MHKVFKAFQAVTEARQLFDVKKPKSLAITDVVDFVNYFMSGKLRAFVKGRRFF